MVKGDPMTCEQCGSTTDVQTYDVPEGDGTVDLCDLCAEDAFGKYFDEPGSEECDDEFTDACTTAADYMRADEGW